LHRFRVLQFVDGFPYLVARIAPVEAGDETGSDIEARALNLKARAAEIFQLLPQIPPEVGAAVHSISSPGHLADLVASLADVKSVEKQEILETFDVQTRLDKVIKLRPKDPNNYLTRGIAYFSKGDYERSIADYTEALHLDAKMVPALNNRCMAHAVVGRDLNQAVADCDEALKLEPKDSFVHINRGLVELKRGQYAKAIAEYDAALAIDPQRARAYYGRGFAKVKTGDKAGGEADILTAKGLQPNVAEEFARYGVN
jgi:tetratricopeptide (TPR) repeat protein